jgi:hypothetical protein
MVFTPMFIYLKVQGDAVDCPKDRCISLRLAALRSQDSKSIFLQPIKNMVYLFSISSQIILLLLAEPAFSSLHLVQKQTLAVHLA